jgi:hypothetical protein
MSGFALSYTANMFILMIVYDFCLLPTQFCFSSQQSQVKSSQVKVKVKVTLRLTVSQSVSLDVEPHVGLMTRYLLLFDS